MSGNASLSAYIGQSIVDGTAEKSLEQLSRVARLVLCALVAVISFEKMASAVWQKYP
jgi:uncharacterized membrane protein YeiB